MRPGEFPWVRGATGIRRARIARHREAVDSPPQPKEYPMSGDSTIAVNRRARHEYHIDETFEAGLVLTGTEIKSVRAHKVNLADAYARVEHGEA